MSLQNVHVLELLVCGPQWLGGMRAQRRHMDTAGSGMAVLSRTPAAGWHVTLAISRGECEVSPGYKTVRPSGHDPGAVGRSRSQLGFMAGLGEGSVVDLAGNTDACMWRVPPPVLANRGECQGIPCWRECQSIAQVFGPRQGSVNGVSLLGDLIFRHWTCR